MTYSLGIFEIPISVDYTGVNSNGLIIKPATVIAMPECPYDFEPDISKLCAEFEYRGQLGSAHGVQHNYCVELNEKCYAVAILHTTTHNYK